MNESFTDESDRRAVLWFWAIYFYLFWFPLIIFLGCLGVCKLLGVDLPVSDGATVDNQFWKNLGL